VAEKGFGETRPVAVLRDQRYNSCLIVAVVTVMVGCGVATSPHRLRWNEVSRIAWAWLVTLPLSGPRGCAPVGRGLIWQG